MMLELMISGFDLVVFTGNTKSVFKDLVVPAVAGLTDASVSLSCVAAHLAPHPGQHFAVAYSATSIESLVENLPASMCVNVPPTAAVVTASEALLQATNKALIHEDDVKGAAAAIHCMLDDFVKQCGARQYP